MRKSITTQLLLYLLEVGSMDLELWGRVLSYEALWYTQEI